VRMVTFSSMLSAHRSDVPKCEGERLGELYTAEKSGWECARILEARIMRIECDVHHGFREGSDARDAGLSGGWALGYGGGRGSGWRPIAIAGVARKVQIRSRFVDWYFGDL